MVILPENESPVPDCALHAYDWNSPGCQIAEDVFARHVQATDEDEIMRSLAQLEDLRNELDAADEREAATRQQLREAENALISARGDAQRLRASAGGHDQRKAELESALAQVSPWLHTCCPSINQEAHYAYCLSSHWRLGHCVHAEHSMISCLSGPITILSIRSILHQTIGLDESVTGPEAICDELSGVPPVRAGQGRRQGAGEGGGAAAEGGGVARQSPGHAGG